MEFKIVQKVGKKHQLYLIDKAADLSQIQELNDTERAFCTNAFKNDQTSITINQYNRFVFIYLLKNKKTDWQTAEALRRAAAEFAATINKQKLDEVTITNFASLEGAAYIAAESMALA